MPLDPRAQRFLERLAATKPPSALSLSVQARRTALQDLLGFSGRPPAIAGAEERSIAGPAGPLALRLYTPLEASTALLIYFHGGGFVAGSLDSHDAICRSLCAASGCRLVSVDYRLAPEHPFPAALTDAYAAVVWITAHAAEFGADPRRIGICGDSAGATLAAVVCQQAAASGAPHLAMQFLLCPIMDFSARSESRHAFAEGYFVDEATLAHDLKYYLGPGADPADVRVSPLRAAELAKLPPSCIHSAEFDPLRDEAEAYAQRLRAAGVAATYRCHSGMIHLFYGMQLQIPAASAAYQLMGADIRSMLN